MVSNRIRRFRNLIVQASAMDTAWLEANLRDYRPNRDVTRLSLLACLRVLCGRNQSGLCYREKRKAIAAALVRVTPRELVSNPALAGTLDITHVTEMGLTQRLSRPIRCF